MIAHFKRESLLRSASALLLLLAVGSVALTDAREVSETPTTESDALFVPSEEEKAARDADMAEIQEKLDTLVRLDFPKGTDIRDIVTFLSDFADVNIVLDERVMLPPPGFPALELDDTVPKIPGAIEPTIPSEMHRIYVHNMPLRNVLEAAFKPAGLEYLVQPNFIWLSRPDVLEKETFEPLETRLVVPKVDDEERKKELLGRLMRIRQILEQPVSVDFAGGTDLHDVLMFLSDFASVNIVLDERVMLPVAVAVAPSAPPPQPPSWQRSPARPSVEGIERTVESNNRRVYIAKGISLGDALAAMLKQCGLDYVVLPEYIWVSRPDVLRKETFRAVETRLRLPEEEGIDTESAKARLEKMQEKLQDRVSADFAEGTDIRDVFEFLADFADVNMVLDERVILPGDGSIPRPVGGIEPTIDTRAHRIYLKHIFFGEALVALCKPLGLDYAVTPEFIWISTPDVLWRESSSSPDELKAASESVSRPRVTITTRRTSERGEETVVIEHTETEGPLPGIEFRGIQQTSPRNIWAMISLDGGRSILVREGQRFARRQAVLEKIDLEAKRFIFRWVPTGKRYEVRMREPPEEPEGNPEETREVSQLLDVGVKLYADGYYRDALERFNRVLAIDPDNKLAQKYTREIIQYLTPGGVADELEVEYPPTQTGTIAPSFMTTPARSFRGLDLTTAPRTTRTSEPADLWEERPRGSKSYSIRDDVVCVFSDLDGRVYHIPNKNRFYIQSDPVWSSTHTFFGPFEGDPVKILKLERASEVLELLDVGVKLYRDGHYGDALDRFNRALVIDPQNKTARGLAEACTRHLTPGRVDEDVEVEYPEGALLAPARAGPSREEVSAGLDTEALLSEMRAIQGKLDNTKIAVDFPEGTDIREVLTFLADQLDVNIVLDERVMLTAGSSPPPPGTPPIETVAQPGEIEEGESDTKVRRRIIHPTVQSEIRRFYVKNVTASTVLNALLHQMGLDYKVQPDFIMQTLAAIWISRPDILRSESFEPLETRRYTLDTTVSRDEIMFGLEIIPDVIEPYTEQILSYVEFNPTTYTVTIHNTPYNFELIEEMLLRLDPPLVSAPPKPLETRRGDGIIAEIRTIERKLQSTTITADYAEGTDIRDVLTLLSDHLNVPIVLDERVMLDSPDKLPHKGRIDRTVEPGVAKLHLEETPADEALKAILEPMGLNYSVQPSFIWVSTSDVLRHESFEPLETRYYFVRDAAKRDEILARLRQAIPDIIEPFTGRPISYMDFTETTKLLIVHNTPSNLEKVEKMLKDKAYRQQ